MIVGLDLSLRGTGAVAIPPSWDLDFTRVHAESFGVDLPAARTTREVTARLRDISRDLREWCIRIGARHVWIEDLPTHAAFNIVPLAELRGVVRLELLDQAQLDVRFVNQSSARKLLLGKLPPNDRKRHVVEALKAAGARFRDSDQADAFTAANAALHELGVPCFTNLLWQPEVKVKVKRARKGKAAA